MFIRAKKYCKFFVTNMIADKYRNKKYLDLG